ncbi:hypothetical protein DACRYDRAFT_103485 [Dacryopinax primogenitus]|uniref:Uncharacterized protein n=1 Tax=Dacryopinax primogenitus (strain DJM 731) TaxID=1858805 RepID=M5GH33_DACPD|nr:uncharacterized protein DACRYDRAFT_103485 [Dacryopinax primogenitus]EJU06538.1 hypothetical protein DACRYDRAFT_103485 [Dacryopinax primogenitus]
MEMEKTLEMVFGLIVFTSMQVHQFSLQASPAAGKLWTRMSQWPSHVGLELSSDLRMKFENITYAKFFKSQQGMWICQGREGVVQVRKDELLICLLGGVNEDRPQVVKELGRALPVVAQDHNSYGRRQPEVSNGSPAPVHLRNAEPGPRMVEDVKLSNPKHPRWGSRVVTLDANNLLDMEDVINGIEAAMLTAMDWEGTINLTLPPPEPAPITVKLPSSPAQLLLLEVLDKMWPGLQTFNEVMRNITRIRGYTDKAMPGHVLWGEAFKQVHGFKGKYKTWYEHAKLLESTSLKKLIKRFSKWPGSTWASFWLCAWRKNDGHLKDGKVEMDKQAWWVESDEEGE